MFEELTEEEKATRETLCLCYHKKEGTVKELIDNPTVRDLLINIRTKPYNKYGDNPVFHEYPNFDFSSIPHIFLGGLEGVSMWEDLDFDLLKPYYKNAARLYKHSSGLALIMEIYEDEIAFYQRVITNVSIREKHNAESARLQNKNLILTAADKIANIGMDKKRKIVKQTYRACATILVNIVKISHQELRDKHKSLYSLVNDCDIRPKNKK